MSDLTRRVALRFSRSPQGKTAGFIPDKFWKAKATELRTLLKKPVKAYDIPYQIGDELIPFFDRFVKDLKAFGLPSEAERSVDDRLDTVKHVLMKVHDAYAAFDRQIDKAAPYPTENVEDEMYLTVSIQVRSYFEDSVKTLGDALKVIWKTDARLITGLADRLLKKMPPEVRDAVERSRLGDYGRASDAKWQWLVEQRLGALAKRLVTKEKVGYNLLQWMSFLWEVLVANYSAEAAKNKDRFRQFDLDGMKVVVLDSTVTDEQMREYIRFLDAAYNRLKQKNLARAWYGKVYIECADCGGVNQNTGGGVGGWFESGPDTVSIFHRPGPFIVELMAHELGHRFWYKQMSSEQRARFESLIRVHKVRRPSDAPPVTMFHDNAADQIKRGVREAEKSILTRLKSVEGYDVTRLAPLVRSGLSSAGWEYGREVVHVITDPQISKDLGPEVDRLKAEVDKTRTKVADHFAEMKQNLDDPARKDVWLKEARELVAQLSAEALHYLDAAFKAHNERALAGLDPASRAWQESYNNAAPVPAVSTYGESNIDEAFAEVFAHYVLGYEITRDQSESFRSVLASELGVVDRPSIAPVLMMDPARRFRAALTAARVASRYRVALLDEKKLVPNPNPDGSKKMVTPQYAEKWEVDHAKGKGKSEKKDDEPKSPPRETDDALLKKVDKAKAKGMSDQDIARMLIADER